MLIICVLFIRNPQEDSSNTCNNKMNPPFPQKPKSKSAATKIPSAKSFLAGARELKVEISHAQLEDVKTDTKPTDNTEPAKSLGDAETTQTTKSNDEINDKKGGAIDKEEETNKASNGITTLFLLTAKPQKFKTGSYGWNANQAKA